MTNEFYAWLKCKTELCMLVVRAVSKVQMRISGSNIFSISYFPKWLCKDLNGFCFLIFSFFFFNADNI